MSVSKISEDKRTSSFLLLVDTDSCEAARHFGVQNDTDFKTKTIKLKVYFIITKTPEKLKEKHGFHHQEACETIESVARDIKLIGHRAYTGQEP